MKRSSKNITTHISYFHDFFDIRIFHKELMSLKKLGYEVHHITRGPDNIKDTKGVVYHQIKESNTQNPILKLLNLIYKVLKITFTYKSPIYHIHEPQFLIFAWILKFKKSKIIYDVHEDFSAQALSLYKNNWVKAWFFYILWRVIENLSKLYVDHYICATETIAKKFPKKYTSIIYNYALLKEYGSDFENISFQQYLRKENILLFCGGISKFRGIDKILSAYLQVSDRLPIKLVLAGSFMNKGTYNFCTTHPVWEQVEYLGVLPRHETLELFNRAKVGLLLFQPGANHNDALPNKLFEYMAAGLPIIASNFTAWEAIIEKKQCGITVNPTDTYSIAEAINKLFTSPELAYKFARNGRKIFEQYYTWESQEPLLESIYEFEINK
ncbi:group 1 glycosyl transferase [endosymbiont of Acanthamoeba sp. UWC8]|uniref:glycosyltransferase family 4 protein n=1 Tax=endosymbiont of Acanthamoeba sp. UWC8 TaxID=86106 RepID=UPI0004D12610|nr:glycosyltransferase family 4 protein [endosymbiont of Acanthamoeba sp. UWC8]AIF82017.1 group 1 glycosyl transferase [endosymbiont of Acanthamoeba sp. UWC8]